MSVTRLWWLSLGIATAVVGVVAALLGLVIAAAKSIDRHAEAIWIVGKQITGNTVSIWMLEQTHTRVTEMKDATRAMEQTVTSMDEKLRALRRAGGSGDGN